MQEYSFDFFNWRFFLVFMSRKNSRVRKGARWTNVQEVAGYKSSPFGPNYKFITLKLYLTVVGKLLPTQVWQCGTGAFLPFCCIILCFAESSSRRPRNTSCWFTTLMPSFMTKNTGMLHASTPWPCSRRRSSAKHPRFGHLRVELQPACKRRYGGKEPTGVGSKFESTLLVSGCRWEQNLRKCLSEFAIWNRGQV